MEGLVSYLDGLKGNEFVVLACTYGTGRAIPAAGIAAEAANKGMKSVFYTIELSEKVLREKLDKTLTTQEQKPEITVVDGAGMKTDEIIKDMQTKTDVKLFVIDYFSLFASEKIANERFEICAELKKLMMQKNAILLCSQNLHRDVTDLHNTEAILDSLKRNGIDVGLVDRILVNNGNGIDNLTIMQ